MDMQLSHLDIYMMMSRIVMSLNSLTSSLVLEVANIFMTPLRATWNTKYHLYHNYNYIINLL